MAYSKLILGGLTARLSLYQENRWKCSGSDISLGKLHSPCSAFAEIFQAAALWRGAGPKPHRSSNSACSTKQASSNYRDLLTHSGQRLGQMAAAFAKLPNSGAKVGPSTSIRSFPSCSGPSSGMRYSTTSVSECVIFGRQQLRPSATEIAPVGGLLLHDNRSRSRTV